MSRRLPNPWVAIPSLAAGLLTGLLGWLMTDLGCRSDDPAGSGCPVAAGAVSAVGFLIGALGMAVVLVLVYRSIAEWREATGRGAEPPGPGCEV
jgi:hypothetical protein